ncbi:MAG: hypothetical protein ACOCXJ_08140 [Planctomycetota bacterium]
MLPRFFAPDSFWNTAIAADSAVDPTSDALLHNMHRCWGGFYLNCQVFAIPVYTVDADTPRHRVRQRGPRPEATGMLHERERRYRQHPDFAAEAVPIPDHARPDPEDDAHLALIDPERGLAWDMWYARRLLDGTWESATGMVYRLDGSGVWSETDFPHLYAGDSIHFHGASRAAGVPAIAGLIMEHELRAGRIEHKLAFAGSCHGARYCPPAVWTDGGHPGGPMQGQVLQLDPDLDVEALDLQPAARCIARALQEYGAVAVDCAGGNVLYAEGLHDHPGRSWDGLLHPDDLRSLPMDRCRWLDPAGALPGGDPFWPLWAARQGRALS